MYFLTVLTFTFLVSASKWTDATLCYSCTDVKNNEECFNVTECPAGEVPQRRNGTSGFTFCSKTCQGDFCSLHTCNLGNITRPPRCLSCDIVDAPNECKNVVECKMHEMCFSEKVTTFQKIKYRFGCVNAKECEAHPVSLQSLIGRRSTANSCSVCCKSDHCNKDACSPNSKGPVYHLKSLSSDVQCPDSDSALCATLGRLNVDACKETSVIKACPKSCVTCGHVGWNTWLPWTSCSNSCGSGTRTRSRDCIRRFSFVGKQPCVGSPSETMNCIGKKCPENGNWCYYHGTRNCRQEHQYYTGWGEVCDHYTRKTTCDCPAPKNGGVCPD